MLGSVFVTYKLKLENQRQKFGFLLLGFFNSGSNSHTLQGFLVLHGLSLSFYWERMLEAQFL